MTFSGGRIAPGEFQEFDLSVGPLPEDVDMLLSSTVQVYENGAEVFRWIEEPLDGGSEPELPAPVLELAAADEDDHGAAAPTSPDGGQADAEQAVDPEDDGTDAVTVVALVVAGLGVVLGALALLRRGAD